MNKSTINSANSGPLPKTNAKSFSVTSLLIPREIKTLLIAALYPDLKLPSKALRKIDLIWKTRSVDSEISLSKRFLKVETGS